MNNKQLSIGLAVLTLIFIFLNFTVEAGTLFLLLAVIAGFGAWYFYKKGRPTGPISN